MFSEQNIIGFSSSLLDSIDLLKNLERENGDLKNYFTQEIDHSTELTLVDDYFKTLRLLFTNQGNQETLEDFVHTHRLIFTNFPPYALNYTKAFRRVLVEQPETNINEFSRGFRHLLENHPRFDCLIEPFFRTILKHSTIDYNAFSQGQLASKIHLVEALSGRLPKDEKIQTIFLCGGWYGTLAPLLFQLLPVEPRRILSLDFDEEANKVAETFNLEKVKQEWRFKTAHTDIEDVDFSNPKLFLKKASGENITVHYRPDLVINTSCEHLTDFHGWWRSLPKGQLVALQSNNAFDFEDHVNCVESLVQLRDMANLSEVYFQSNLPLENYIRFTIIGRK